MTLPKSGEAKKVNLDFNKEFISTFTRNIENRNVEFINISISFLRLLVYIMIKFKLNEYRN